MKNKKHNGFAIALAWPQTYCKQPGAWYDGITSSLGFSENNYYKVGHAAVVLIDAIKSECHYFDFGRYHSPFQHGRVRGAITDHELKMQTKPLFAKNGKEIKNYNEILNELQNNKSCHGEGDLHASYCSINFNKAYNKAIKMQNNSPIPYGPFRYKGSNCSRFVYSVVNAGKPKLTFRIKLNFLVPLTPTPLSNISAFKNKQIILKPLGRTIFKPIKKPDKKLLKTTLIEPVKDKSIPKNSQWLSGEGAGSWFWTELIEDGINMKRFSPDGKLECSGFFRNQFFQVQGNDKYRVSYPSNCSVLTLSINNKKITFERFKSIIQDNETSIQYNLSDHTAAVNF